MRLFCRNTKATPTYKRMSLDMDDEWNVTLTGAAAYRPERGGAYSNQPDVNPQLTSTELFLCNQCRTSAHTRASLDSTPSAMIDFSRYTVDPAYRTPNPAYRSIVESSPYRSRTLYEGRATSIGSRNVGCSSHTLPSQAAGRPRPVTGIKVDHAHLGWLTSQANIYQHPGHCRRQPLRSAEEGLKKAKAVGAELEYDRQLSSPAEACCCYNLPSPGRYLQGANCGSSGRSSPVDTSSNNDPCARLGPTAEDAYTNRPSLLRGTATTKSSSVSASVTSRSRRWKRLRTLLFLLCVTAGMLAAALGVVLGLLLSYDVTASRQDTETTYNRSIVTSDTQHDSLQYINITSTAQNIPIIKDQQGWAVFSGGSANGSRYLVIDKAVAFSTGQSECQKRGGHLAHVNSIREQIFIEDFITTFPEVTKDGKGLWLGGRRARGSHAFTCMYDQWKWVDFYGRQYGVVQGFAAFGPGKPDDRYSPEECLYLNFEGGPRNAQFLKWDDAPCDMQGQHVIKILCEVDMR